MIRKLLIGLVSLVVSLAVARAVLRKVVPHRRSTVRVVDTSKAMFRLLRSREVLAAAQPRSPGLVRVRLDEEVAATFFPVLAHSKYHAYDPHTYMRLSDEFERPFVEFPEHPDGGFWMRVNALGLREDEEVADQKRDLRVLVTGDSHTTGLCANSESFPNVLEGLIAAAVPDRDVEVLNGGVGHYTFYNYLGVLERLLHLEPDVFVVVPYGGNDFSGAAVLQRYFEARGPMEKSPRSRGSYLLAEGVGPQETAQLTYFRNNPGDVEHAVRVATEVLIEIARLCAEHDIELLVVYLPPPSRGQPELYEEMILATLQALELEPEALEISDRLATPWLAELDRRGIRTVDLRPDFRTAEERLYWETDLHLNLAGHRFVAARLLGELVPLLTER